METKQFVRNTSLILRLKIADPDGVKTKLLGLKKIQPVSTQKSKLTSASSVGSVPYPSIKKTPVPKETVREPVNSLSGVGVRQSFQRPLSTLQTEPHTASHTNSISVDDTNESVEYDDFVNKNTLYNDKNKWPKSTNIRCWYCTLHFNTIPCPLPYKYDPKTNTFSVKGCFCSLNCALAYNLESRNSDKGEINSLIHLINKKMFGSTKFISPAPSRYLLKEYGGKWTRDEYRSHLNTNIVGQKILFPPFVTTEYLINNIKPISTRDKKTNSIHFKKIDNAINSLTTLKRNKESIMDKIIKITG